MLKKIDPYISFLTIISLIVIVFSFSFIMKHSKNEIFDTIKGTYSCEEFPYIVMIFHEEDNNKFYYYNPFSKDENKKLVIGYYSKNLDNSYTIYCDTNDDFNNKIIISKNNKFSISLKNLNFIFKKDSPNAIFTFPVPSSNT